MKWRLVGEIILVFLLALAGVATWLLLGWLGSIDP